MFISRYSLAAALILIFGLLGCSASAPERPVADSLQRLSLSVQLSRTSLFSNEFEQYRLSGNSLFFECGNFARNNYKPREQQVLVLSSDALTELVEKSQDLIDSLPAHAKWDEPGKNDSVADPGQASLLIELGRDRSELKTSLDAIVNDDAAAARNLVRALRHSAGNPCGNQKFFGL